jgi:DNA-binding NarL/FixJ family response regulator
MFRPTAESVLVSTNSRKRLSPMEDLSGKVLVVDDDSNLRELVRSLLERAGYATLGFASGEDILAAAVEQPALVILDIKLPGLSGYEVCRELKERFGSGLPVLFVSGVRTEAFDRAAGLLIGADDYLVKPLDPDELIARVRRHLPPRPRGAGAPSGVELLTPRELEVLRFLAGGMSQPEIAKRLVISPKTVATHIQHTLVKLGVHSRAQAVAAAHRHGLIASD